MSTPTAPSPLHHLTEQLESIEALDEPGQAIGRTVRGALGPGTLKDLLSGTWLGHTLHPLLTDVVIGTWTSATLLDLVGGRDEEARKLVGAGLLAYPIVAVTGLNDWADTEPADPATRRLGLIHAAANAAAASLYAVSWRARRRGNHGAGALWSLLGMGAMSAGGYLGGHMSYARGVGVDQTRFDAGPEEWTPTSIAASDLTEGEPRCTIAGETPVMLVREGGAIHAIHDRCSHRGCSLGGLGEYRDGIVECGCHGSRFRVADGELQRGPATTGQPSYDVRESDGRIEVKLHHD